MTLAKVSKVVAAVMIFTLSFSVVSLVPSLFIDASATEDEMHDEHEKESTHEEKEQHGAENMSNVNEGGLVRIEEHLGENSMVLLKAEKQVAHVIVHVEEGDLADGSHNVTIACESPESSLTFAEKLEVSSGSGEFEGTLTLRPGTYSDCTITAGSLSAMVPSFTIAANVQHGHSHGSNEAEPRVHVKHDGIVRFEGMVMHRGFAAGAYDVTLSCELPEGLSVMFNDVFVMDEEGEGKLLIETSFGPGSYQGCEASIAESDDQMVIAMFDTFSIKEAHESDGRTVEEKRHERKHAILERIKAGEIHNGHDTAKASSIGDYDPDMEYSLAAHGTVGAHGDSMMAEADLDIGVWKSNRAIILMDVMGGTVSVGEANYTIWIGYATYSLQHDVLSLRALGTNDATDEIVSLKMRGHAASEDATFPIDHGDMLEIHFEGNNGRASNQIGAWELFLEGTIGA